MSSKEVERRGQREKQVPPPQAAQERILRVGMTIARWVEILVRDEQGI
jgi:hypothetical protein